MTEILSQNDDAVELSRVSYTVREIAARNGVTHPVIYREIAAGRLRSFKIGRCRRVTLEAERDWQQMAEKEASAN